MTLEEIENTLPNGLHDAEISNINIDYIKREVAMTLEIWTGDPTSKEYEIREAYRLAKLILYNFLYFAIEPPDATYPYDESKALCVGTGSMQKDEIPAIEKLPNNIPTDAFGHWFFVNSWNAFIFVAAMDAKLEWKDVE